MLNLPALHQAHSQVSRFGEAQYIFKGTRFLLLLYVKSNFFGRNKIWGSTNEIWRGTGPECPPVATGLLCTEGKNQKSKNQG